MQGRGCLRSVWLASVGTPSDSIRNDDFSVSGYQQQAKSMSPSHVSHPSLVIRLLSSAQRNAHCNNKQSAVVLFMYPERSRHRQHGHRYVALRCGSLWGRQAPAVTSFAHGGCGESLRTRKEQGIFWLDVHGVAASCNARENRLHPRACPR